MIIIYGIPVHGEEEVVDANGDGVPGGGHVTPTGRENSIFMNGKLCQVENQSWCVGYQENKN